MLLRIIFQAFPGIDPPSPDPNDPGAPGVEPTITGPPACQSAIMADPATLFSPAQFQFLLGQISGAIELVAAQGAAVEHEGKRAVAAAEAAKPKVYVPGFVKP